ncbi:hypothetical protein H8D57_01430 [bacterium]|nr:hypothetical protein [bacterium]
MKTREPIKHEIVNEDTVFVGTAAEIVLDMRQQAYFERGTPPEFYLDQLVNFIKIFAGETITLSGKTFETKAESFIQELLRIEYFKEA